MSIEIAGLLINATGWAVAVYFAKRFADSIVQKLNSLQEREQQISLQLKDFVTRLDCASAVGRLHQRLEEDDLHVYELGVRISKLEGAAGK